MEKENTQKGQENKENILKKWYFWVIIVLVILIVIILLKQPKTNVVSSTDYNGFKTDSSSSTIIHDTNINNNATSSSVSEPEIKEIKKGDKIITSDYEFTLKDVSFSYNVKPSNPPSWYTYYKATSGKVYIFIDADIKNTGKTDLPCDEVYSVEADYNNGYTYTGFNVAEDSDGDFTYANITNITPLETLGNYYLIEVPEEVKNNKKAPLFLTFTLKDNTKYKYNIR